MTPGQGDLGLALEAIEQSPGASITLPVSGAGLRVLRANQVELAAHRQRLKGLDAASAEGSIWNRAAAESI